MIVNNLTILRELYDAAAQKERQRE